MKRRVFQCTSDAERTTLGDIIKRFKKEFAPFHYRKRADEKEAWRFQLDRLNDAMGKYSLAAIDAKLIAAFRDSRLAGGADRKAVAESTVRKEIYMLSKVLDFAQTECDIALPRGNPVDKIRKPTERKGRNRRLTDDEWTKLTVEIDASRNPYISAAFQLSVETAMRQGELLQVTWRDVDLKRKFIMLSDPDRIKNEEVRAVPLSSKAVAVLKGLPNTNKGPVLPVDHFTLYHAFIYALDVAGIDTSN